MNGSNILRKNKVLITKLSVAYVGNIIDIIATLLLTGLGAEELNPIMAWLLQWPAAFVTVKIILMSYAVTVIWFAPKTRTTEICVWIVFLTYGLIGLYYIGIFLFMCATFTGGALVI